MAIRDRKGCPRIPSHIQWEDYSTHNYNVANLHYTFEIVLLFHFLNILSVVAPTDTLQGSETRPRQHLIVW